MGLTVTQRLQELERSIIVLNDTMKLLHNLLKKQKQVINDYIVQKVSSANKVNAGDRPCGEIYAFVCKQRFDRIDKDIKRILKLVEDSKGELKTCLETAQGHEHEMDRLAKRQSAC